MTWYDEEEREEEQQEQQNEVTEKLEQIQQQLNEWQRQLLQSVQQQPQQQPQVQQPYYQFQPTPPVAQQQQSIDESVYEQLGELLHENPKEFVKTYTQVVQNQLQQTLGMVYRTVAELNAWRQQLQLQQLAQQFYATYPDLVGFETIVQAAAQKVYPQKTWTNAQEYFQAVAEEARRMIREIAEKAGGRVEPRSRLQPAGLPAQSGITSSAVTQPSMPSPEFVEAMMENLNRQFVEELEKVVRQKRSSPPPPVTPSRRR